MKLSIARMKHSIDGCVVRRLAFTALLVTCAAPAAQQKVDLSRAVILSAANLTSPEKKAIAMLQDEVERRTGVRWEHAQKRTDDSRPVIAVGQADAINALLPGVKAAPAASEGFQIGFAEAASTGLFVSGSDPRGVLFGTGYLLRKLEMRKGEVLLAADLSVTTAPETRLRGHQLGYRPKTNSYDGWSLPMWEQYVRDLAVFGTNAVELIPPRSDDDADSPHFPAPPMEMMIGMSKLLDDYGMDVWIWYPALDKDYADPKTVEFALNEWGEVFRRLPRIDAILVPAGDPGHTPARILMPMLEKQAANLRRYHPEAQLWIAPQGFDAENIEHFFEMAGKRPKWLAGVVYGPQTRISLEELRERLPKEYPIRHYPDITHTRSSQYPVPEWDAAFALTLSREPINPRPTDQSRIFQRLHKHTIGFITYSEGCNDDVNKMIWSGLGWKHDTSVIDILRDYGRYFMGPDYAEGFAQGLLALERNWRGPALTNASIGTTLQQFQSMERTATPQILANWRFQQALYRAYYDAYVRNRLIYETDLENRAMEKLRGAPETGTLDAIREAEEILDRAEINRVAADLRSRVFELAEALFNSIRMQLSVEKYKAISVGRGANLDTIDVPLNSRGWLKEQFARVRRLEDEDDRQKEIGKIVNWTNPGPGGFYDDLGSLTRQRHLVRGPGFVEDPQFFRSSLTFFDAGQQGPKSWWDQTITFYEQPLQMKYENLDPAARYKVRVVYGAGPLRLRAAGSIEIHGYLDKPYEVLEFAVPEEAINKGELTLEWNRSPGGGGAGRGCQVAEVWLIRN
ncbi:MAG: hypothetical protein ACRD7E_09230 [Bryobacteraceae bacterium]